MNDKELQEELLGMLHAFEAKMDWVGETPIRHKVSEHIVEIYKLLRWTPEQVASAYKKLEKIGGAK